jgi:hypothetical protein
VTGGGGAAATSYDPPVHNKRSHDDWVVRDGVIDVDLIHAWAQKFVDFWQ